jgi:hypothetical protein
VETGLRFGQKYARTGSRLQRPETGRVDTRTGQRQRWH